MAHGILNPSDSAQDRSGHISVMQRPGMNVQNDRGAGKSPECKEQRRNERHKRLEALRVELPTGSLTVYNSWSGMRGIRLGS